MHRLPVPDPWFAHQFGWDEVLMFAVPIVLALVGVRFAESRVAKRQAAEAAAAAASDAAAPHDGEPEPAAVEAPGDDST